MLKCRFPRWFLFGFIFLFEAAQAEPLILEKSISLFQYSEMLEDPSGKLSFEQVRNGNHTFLSVADGSLASADIRRGVTRSAFWLKLNLVDHTHEAQWFIKDWGGVNKKVEVYLRSGEEQAFSSLPVLSGYRGTVFKFASAHRMQHTLYLRVQDIQTPLELAAQLITTSRMLNLVNQNYPTYAVFGGLLILALYNLFYFLFLRDVGFLALAIFIAAFTVEMGSYMGILSYFSFTRHYLHYAGTGFGFIGMASFIAVISHLFELKQLEPTWHLFFRVAFWVCLALALLAPFIYYGTAITAIICLILTPVVITVFVRLYLKGYRFLKSVILAMLVCVASFIPPLLMGVGVIDLYGPLINFSALGLLIALVLLSLTQAEQVRNKSDQADRIMAANQAKDEFLTTMSHELRTPMHAVVGAGRLLGMMKLGSEPQELISRLNYSSSHMLSLVNDILDLARTESHLALLEKQPFKLSEVLESLDKLLCESTDTKGLSLSLKNHFMPLHQELVGDATRIKQILLNLLNNAIKFTEQGHVRLTITPQQVEPDSVRLLFEVSDTGIGIPKDKQKDLFQPFTQAEASTTRRYGGSGLGLAISQKLVQCMGGELAIESQVDKGSCFFFTIDLLLQAITDEVEVSSTKPLLANTERLNSMHVMLVDDDEMNRFFGEKLLQACGVSVVVADSGGQALEYLQRQTFDLMLLDVSMPGMNGYQTAQAIRSQSILSNLTIVALTAHAIVGERERCLAAGMNDFLTKPFELADLQKMLHKYIDNTGSSLSQSGTH